MKQVKRTVQALSTLDYRLYVAYNKISEIEAYETESLIVQNNISIQGLFDPCDIVNSQEFLFVSENEEQFIHRYELKHNRTMKWNVCW